MKYYQLFNSRLLIDFVISTMDCHFGSKSIQYSSTAILANLFKLNDGILNEKSLTFFGLEKQQNLIKIMIGVMNEHQSDPLLLKNGL